MTDLTIKIGGMMCDGCVARVRKLIEKTGVAERSEVSIGRAKVPVADSEQADVVIETLRKAGYPVEVVTSND